MSRYNRPVGTQNRTANEIDYYIRYIAEHADNNIKITIDENEDISVTVPNVFIKEEGGIRQHYGTGATLYYALISYINEMTGKRIVVMGKFPRQVEKIF